MRCWHGYLSGARCRLAYMARLMPLPLTVSCFSKIQIGFTTQVVPEKGPLNGCVCVCVYRVSSMHARYGRGGVNKRCKQTYMYCCRTCNKLLLNVVEIQYSFYDVKLTLIWMFEGKKLCLHFSSIARFRARTRFLRL